MNTLTKTQIKTIGNYLEYYYSDLKYFNEFKKSIKRNIDNINDEYLNKSNPYSFKSFLNGYGISRRVKKIDESNLVNTLKLYKTTKKWLNANQKNATDIKGFVEYITTIKNLTNGKNEISLASKILFLNNPMEVYPYDYNAKTTLDYNGNDYEEYKSKVINYKDEHIDIIKKIINCIEPYLETLEKGLEYSKEEFKKIRVNRFVDKMLWCGWKDSE
jgi:hypothetical protein